MKIQRLFWAMILLCVAIPNAWAKQHELTGVRLWDAPEKTRVVFDTSAAVDYSVFTLDNPHRVVVDLKGTRLKTDLPSHRGAASAVRKIRSGIRNKRDLRVVLDVASLQDVHSFTLKPNQQYGNRIVVEVGKDHAAPVVQTPAPAKKSTGTPANRSREIVVAIDAGHGGEDPGALGYHGTREKDVVLSIANRLYAKLDREPGIRPVLTRKRDYYISLRKRIDLARQHKADLFVSIHADAFTNRNVKGSSVYVLSPKGGSDEAARWLAERENAADLIGGVSLDDKDDMLAQVLMDLSLNGTIDVSTRIAGSVLGEIKKVAPVHKRTVQSAGFVVLKSPDIPSMLIETAFISNPREERRLREKGYQDKLAKSILRGIRSYFRQNPPPGTLFAARGQSAHVIRPGDTLSRIAQQYHVSLNSLRRVNALRGDVIRAGQRLQIPAF